MAGIISDIIIGAIGVLVGAIVLDIYARFKAGSKKAIEKKKKIRTAEIRETVNTVMEEIVQPLLDGQTEIKNKLAVMEDGMVATLRNDLLHSYDFCAKQGYRTAEDTQNWTHMYESYKALGGNSFVDSLKVDFLELPTEQEFRRTQNEKFNEGIH